MRAEKTQRKVAIMTWYKYKNYGTALQASALYHIVKQHGYLVDLIQYMPKGDLVDYSIKGLMKRMARKIKSVLNGEYVAGDLFDSFLKERISETYACRSYAELHDLNRKFDAFLCGSDQVWSPLCYDDKYFLSFVDNSNKMIAYGPSMGPAKISNNVIENRIKENVSRFKHISVREKQAARLIEQLTGQEPKVVLDPTLLMEAREWDAYAEVENVRKIQNAEYIICYFLGEYKKYMKYVHLLAKKMGLPFYLIPVTKKQKNSGYVVPFDVGPSEFVSLISNAKYVCTDSFHGMAFAINYKVPFSVFKRFKDNDKRNQNSRIFSLLQMIDLENRLVDYKCKRVTAEMQVCDFTKVDSSLEKYRKESMDYLEQALEKAVSCLNGGRELYKITDFCCGCGACASVCGLNAISIEKNEEGFEQYSINSNICIQCGRCKTVCPMTNIGAQEIRSSKALYSLKSTSEQVLKASSSGGVAHEIASSLLDRGYAICGCIYDDLNKVAKHIWITPDMPELLPLLQGSKYIQSISAKALEQIVHMASRYQIAFFGTPCQAAAVDKILRMRGLREKAVVVDLICHGIPSYYLWEQYLEALDSKYNIGKSPIIKFRSKEIEWHRRLMVVSGNGKVYKREERKDDFYAFFRRGLCDMAACFECPYREKSASDLRLGDYWGGTYAKDRKGVSMVIANSETGDSLVKFLEKQKNCFVQKHELGEYWKEQYPYNLQRPLVREQLIGEIRKGEVPLHKLRKKYCWYFDLMEWLCKVKSHLLRVLK